MRKRLWFGMLLSGSIALGMAATSVADDDHHEGSQNVSGAESHESGKPRKRVAAPKNDMYNEECGSCHIAYPARFLTADAWRRIMGNLDNHFGDNAELGAETAQKISAYLESYASHHRDRSESATALSNSPLPRITQAGWFRREHREIPSRLVNDSAKVKRFSDCAACHQRAESGSFRERDIRIPGYGRWED